MNSKKGVKRQKIKSCILKGRPIISHYSNQIIPARVQTIDFDCECKIKCSKTFSDRQKQKIFNRYNCFKSHDQQYIFLKSLVIPVKNNSIDNKNQKFEYLIETMIFLRVIAEKFVKKVFYKFLA